MLAFATFNDASTPFVIAVVEIVPSTKAYAADIDILVDRVPPLQNRHFDERLAILDSMVFRSATWTLASLRSQRL